VADGNPEAFTVEDLLHAMEVRTMVRPPLENIELPLMNHLVRQRADNFLLGLTLEKRHRQPNQAAPGAQRVSWNGSGTRADVADEHAGRGGQASAPDDVDRRKDAPKKASVEFRPGGLQSIGHEAIRSLAHGEGPQGAADLGKMRGSSTMCPSIMQAF
jgi:hypothetical protein